MNKYRQEYIGKNIVVEHSPNNTLQGVKGVVRDETLNTFLVQTQKTFKTIPKHPNIFNIDNNTIQGQKIIRRPHQRINIKS